MYAKSFLALNSTGRLTGARTALCSPSDAYTCHHCDSPLVLHADAERPWFAHTTAALTERGRQECPYTHPAAAEVRFIHELRRYVPNAKPVVHHAGQCLRELGCHVEGEVICA
ncbi:zinc-ribbon domain-containing protein [Citrobacter portucalensis]|uniref:zinc-ribbon domain-containing protein n=1 Tax=Citrobacter portucalensis TaxID=1639133 RepID=UPI00214D4C28|nr:zinc-ribbon domain-containing protein [Citrobacter portucalensis]MCR3700706.1 zinc-ribbon domain-containing protein [Citrobacter portucalensis]